MPDEWTDEGAVLVVRVWSETPHDVYSFRARVVTMSGPGLPASTTAAATPEAVIELVKAFLEGYVTGSRPA